MFESIVSITNLPNLHPAFVHFPIALLCIALLSDVLAPAFLSADWLRKTASFLYVLGAVSAGATFWTGRQAADSVDISAQAQSVLARHENFALYTLLFFAVYAVGRLALHQAGKLHSRSLLHVIAIVIGAAGQGLLFTTADLGGALVYRHAVAVERPAVPVLPKPEPAGTAPIMEQGRISWHFEPDSDKRLMEFFDVLSGSRESLQIGTEAVDGKHVLTLANSSKEPVMIAFKPAYGDIQMEAEIYFPGFIGGFALVHHATASGYDFFRFDSGRASLGRNLLGKEQIFGEEEIDLPAGFCEIKTVSADGHFRGYLCGKLVVHGHGKTADSGKAGILIGANSSVELTHIGVFPLEEEKEHEH